MSFLLNSKVDTLEINMDQVHALIAQELNTKQHVFAVDDPLLFENNVLSVTLHTGSTGFTGYTGVTGSTGYTGWTGSTGYTGVTGSTGYTGVTGSTGWTGSTGYTG